MRFLTWANDPSDPRCELLFASARHFGIHLEPIGVGKEYRGGVSKIEWLRDWCEEDTWPTTICCVDSHDSLFLCPVDDMEKEWSDMDSDIVYSGERWYRGRPPGLQEYFTEAAKWCGSPESIYCYPNCGGFVGDSLHVKHFMQNAWSLPKVHGDAEQWYLTQEIAFSGLNDVRVDLDCRLFYCCGGEWRRFAGEVVDGRFRNKRTGSYPYILHAPIPRRSLPIRERIAKELGII